MTKTYTPEVLYDGRYEKTWKDINGILWKKVKTTGNLYQLVKGEWQCVEKMLVELMSKV